MTLYGNPQLTGFEKTFENHRVPTDLIESKLVYIYTVWLVHQAKAWKHASTTSPLFLSRVLRLSYTIICYA